MIQYVYDIYQNVCFNYMITVNNKGKNKTVSSLMDASINTTRLNAD